MVYRIINRLFWRVLKRRTLFNCFGAFIHGESKSQLIPAVIFLFRSMRQFPANSGVSFKLDEWQSVLKLASLYEMDAVKTLAIEKMEPLLTTVPSLQVQLAKAYNIRKWLAPGFFRLAQRTRPLDEWDVRLLGLSDSLKICALREKIRRCEKCSACGAGIHSGGFGLGEIGHAFHITGSDLPSSVAGCERNCTCPSNPPPAPAGFSGFGAFGGRSQSFGQSPAMFGNASYRTSTFGN
jgi:hypothetical protein